jgi:uncharacterized membrane protein
MMTRSNNGTVSGLTGVALGAGLAAAVPLAVKGASKLARKGPDLLHEPIEQAGEKLKTIASDVLDEKIREAGGVGGIAMEVAKSLIPGLGGGGNEAPGVGKGRRMPVQQSVDVGVPVATVYNQFTQFEEWPTFMHRVTSVSQEDETHIAFKSKIWGVSKEFQAEIDEQRPDERVKWHVVEGLSHKGVVTFHELAPRLTRVELNIDVEPGSPIEKFARGARHVKRAMRADLHRFKAYVMMNEEASGEWRGTIDEGEVKSTKSSSSHDDSGPERGGASPGQAKPASSSSRSSSSGRSRSSSNRSQSSSGADRGDPSMRAGARRHKSGSRS